MLNNYDKTYSNIIFWIENPNMVIRLANIEDGTYKSSYKEDVTEQRWNKELEMWYTFVLYNASMEYRCTPSDRYSDIELLLKERMGVSVGNFKKYFNRYVRTWCKKNGFENKSEDEDVSAGYNAYPVPLETFLAVCELNSSDYNIDKLMTDLETEKYIGFSDLEKYEIKKSTLDVDAIEGILAAFPDKLAEYKAGKANLLNMFFGEYMKKLADKNIDKNALRTELQSYIDKK